MRSPWLQRPWRFLIPLAVVFLVVNGYFGWQAWNIDRATAETPESYKTTLLFTRVVELIRQDYVEEKKTSYKDLTYAALRGMLTSLDPHSQFMDEEAYAEIQKDTRGEFNGLGIVVSERDNAFLILSAQEGSPSFKAGILPGDRILKIDGKSTDHLNLNAVIKRLRGNKGEGVALTLYRPPTGEAGAEGQVREFNLVRDTIKVPSVREARLLPGEVAGEDRIGYARLDLFGDNTNDELEEALNKMEQQGMQSLILDLRNNPGGLIDAAVDVAGQFLPPRTVVVTTQGRNPDNRREYPTHNVRQRVRYPMVVLVNSYTASAAEIVSGALKDLRRAVILGDNTFGKGSVQTVQPLGGGLGLRMTTAKYFTPAKRTIHEVGIAPDISAPVTEGEERALAQIRTQQYLTEEERKQIRTQRDTQLERAVAILKGIRLYLQRQPPPQPVPSADSKS